MTQTAIIHDWLPTLGGAEHVVKEMLDVSGAKDLYTLFDFLSPDDRAYFGDVNIHTSGLNALPKVERYYRYLIMACARAIEGFDLRQYDTIVSSSACFAKGILTGADQKHIAYIHSPPRYAWDLTHEYLDDADGLWGFKRWVAARSFHKLRMWDVRTVHAMDHVLANSEFVARRIKKLYGRDAGVLYPPVDTAYFADKRPDTPDDYYVVACRLVGYKRVDEIVKAFTAMPDKKLVVVGDGPDRKRIQGLAGSNIEFKGYLPREDVARIIAGGRAFVYAALEDFGIVPVEAQAAGLPVIGYGKGGLLETVRGAGKNRTGLFFDHQTADAIRNAVEWFDANQSQFSRSACQDHARSFDRTKFQSGLAGYL